MHIKNDKPENSNILKEKNLKIACKISQNQSPALCLVSLYSDI